MQPHRPADLPDFTRRSSVMGSTLFICPHWHQFGNVGVLRARRMVRWMHEAGWTVTVLCAGSRSRLERADFGSVITRKDPLGIFTENDGPHGSAALRRPNRFRRLLAYALLTPDLQLPWALACRWSTDVQKAAANSQVILSSSPPESAHVLAGWLHLQHDVPHIIDLRDGWLDEPMKPLLKSSSLQQLREKRLEKRLLTAASAILVTSHEWKSLLRKRYPQLSHRIQVLTNAYPDHPPVIRTRQPVPDAPLRVLHAGRISSSRPERNPQELLSLLFQAFTSVHESSGSLIFLGSIEHEEADFIRSREADFSARGWTITRESQVSHARALERMAATDLLILYSASQASIPAKFFDYLHAGKPILCICPPGSAVWHASEDLAQVYRLNPEQPDFTQLKDFIVSSKKSSLPGTALPVHFSDRHLGRRFIDLLNQTRNPEIITRGKAY